MLPKSGEFVVITKSLKDLCVLYEYGIPAIAPCSENEFLSDAQYERICKRFKHRLLLWDNDLPGVSSANKIRKKHSDIEVMFIPKGDKDISDYRKAHGHQKTLDLIEKTKAYYEEKWREEDEIGCLKDCFD